LRKFLVFVVGALCLAVPNIALAQTPAWPDGAWLRGQHVLIRFTGVLRAPPGFTRTKEEARKRAIEVIARATAGESFDDLVQEFTDEPDGAKGHGDLGLVGPGTLLPDIEQALLNMKVGEVSRTPVQTVFGFHVLRRLPSERRIEIRHILVSYAGALRAKIGLKRTRDQARSRALDISSLLASGQPFDETARKMSDDVASAANGGTLGELRVGLTVPAFEAVAFSLEPGEVSAPVETPFGFHIIQRVQ
jgi:parvulin-like peptidyl-prolyl isomerase